MLFGEPLKKEATPLKKSPAKTTHSQPKTKKHSLGIHYAPGIYGAGDIIESAAVGGFDTLETLVNLQWLQAPGNTLLVQTIGPVYKMPELELRAEEFGVDYERKGRGGLSYTFTAKYLKILGRIGMPAAYADWSQFGIDLPGYYEVTRATGNKLVSLIDIFQLEAGVVYYFRDGKNVQPYVRGWLGGGRGWLGEERATWVIEGHVSAGVGLRFKPRESNFIKLEVNFSKYLVQSRSTPLPFDYRKVLVNPGRGRISIAHLYFGAGILY